MLLHAKSYVFESVVMKKNLYLLFSVLTLTACASYEYQPAKDMTQFYKDKLACENTYTQGFNIWGNKVYGDITKEGPARDCMLARGYLSKN